MISDGSQGVPHDLQDFPGMQNSSLPLRSESVPMDEDAMLTLKNMHLAPYIQLATSLIGKLRRSGGNMFRHQLDTMGYPHRLRIHRLHSPQSLGHPRSRRGCPGNG